MFFNQTLTSTGVSLMAPSGMIPGYDVIDCGSFIKEPDEEDLSPDNPLLIITVRRWQTGDEILPGPELCATMHLFEHPMAKDWSGEPTPFQMDGLTGEIRRFDCHNGDVGFVATANLGLSIVTIQSSWPADCPEIGDELVAAAASARFLLAGDLMAPKTSIVHPVIGVSVEVHDHWLVDEPGDETLNLVTEGGAWSIGRETSASAIDPAWTIFEISIPGTYDDFTFARNGFTDLVGVSEGPRPLVIRGHVSSGRFDDLIELCERVRTHPAIDWS